MKRKETIIECDIPKCKRKARIQVNTMKKGLESFCADHAIDIDVYGHFGYKRINCI